ncbi:hypothetical protein F444_15048 [Phytophthora nicotianae P1976]|nr:hypothetical protein F444_15048 [Phytophthora nicotianae P1976]
MSNLPATLGSMYVFMSQNKQATNIFVVVRCTHYTVLKHSHRSTTGTDQLVSNSDRACLASTGLATSCVANFVAIPLA